MTDKQELVRVVWSRSSTDTMQGEV